MVFSNIICLKFLGGFLGLPGLRIAGIFPVGVRPGFLFHTSVILRIFCFRLVPRRSILFLTFSAVIGSLNALGKPWNAAIFSISHLEI